MPDAFRCPPDVIMLAVRWYLRYGLSYRDVEELLLERGIQVDHVTVYRWVQRFTPLLMTRHGPVGTPLVIVGSSIRPTPRSRDGGCICTGPSMSSVRSSTCWSPGSGTWRPPGDSSLAPWNTGRHRLRSPRITRLPTRSDQPRFEALGCSDCTQCNSPLRNPVRWYSARRYPLIATLRSITTSYKAASSRSRHPMPNASQASGTPCGHIALFGPRTSCPLPAPPGLIGSRRI